MYSTVRIITSVSINSCRLMSQTTAEYCMNSVKKYDYENFICSLLLPNTTRSCAFAIRSFNVEVARVIEQVSQKNIAHMRMKFWEETVEKCMSRDSKSVPKHPVAIELFKAHNRNKLTKRYFNNLISSRLELASFSSLADLEDYSEKSVSSVYYLILEGSGIKNVNADHAASHLGKAQGISQQLRSVPHAGRLNFVPIPIDLLIKYKLRQEDILRSKQNEKLDDCIFEIATRAHQHLIKARSLMTNVPKEARSILLPAVPISSYLYRLQRVHYDVFHSSLQYRSWKLLPHLWITKIRNKY